VRTRTFDTGRIEDEIRAFHHIQTGVFGNRPGYVARTLDRVPPEVSPKEASDLVHRLAKENGWDLIRTDHASWRFESG